MISLLDLAPLMIASLMQCFSTERIEENIYICMRVTYTFFGGDHDNQVDASNKYNMSCVL